jgi:CBS domain-containing protein
MTQPPGQSATRGPVYRDTTESAHAQPAANRADQGRTTDIARGTAAEAMIHAPKISTGTTTVADVREIFRDDHVHCVLIVEHGRLLAVVERSDVQDAHPAALALLTGKLQGRVIGPEDDLATARHLMTSAQRRRLAVVDDHGVLLGLLCLKRTGLGFCSDDDVRGRATERAAACSHP